VSPKTQRPLHTHRTRETTWAFVTVQILTPSPLFSSLRLHHCTNHAPLGSLLQLKLSSQYKSFPQHFSSPAKACITVQIIPPPPPLASLLQQNLASQYNHAPLTPLLQLKLASQFNHAPLTPLLQLKLASQYKSCPPRFSSPAKACITVQIMPTSVLFSS
jgi:hypothetical protein